MKSLVFLRHSVDMCVAYVCVQIQNLDLTKHRLLRDGKMIWRLGGGKQVAVYVALFADIIVLMQQQEGKFVLRSHSIGIADKEKINHGPVIKLRESMAQKYAAGMYCQLTKNVQLHF